MNVVERTIPAFVWDDLQLPQPPTRLVKFIAEKHCWYGLDINGELILCELHERGQTEPHWDDDQSGTYLGETAINALFNEQVAAINEHIGPFKPRDYTYLCNQADW